MRCKPAPCKSGCKDGDLYPNYYESGGGCGTPYCHGPSETHCRKCGWFTMSCLCGSCNGASKVSARTWDDIQRRKKARKP